MPTTPPSQTRLTIDRHTRIKPRFAYPGDRCSGIALAAWCACLWLGAVSCSPTKPAEPSPTLPTLDQVRSRLGPETRSTGLPDSTPGDQLAAMLHVTQLDMPLNASTKPAWALTDEDGLDPSTVDAWQANGLRVGLLDPADYKPFLQALPPGHPARNRRTTLTEQPTVCTTVPKHKDRPSVRIVMPPAHRPSTLRVDPGRFQFLAQLVQRPNDTAALRLTPHHYQPRTTVRPRLPQDKIQDGLVFHTLALSVPVDREAWLVIGLDRPQAEPVVNDDKAAADPPATQPTPQPNVPKPANYVLPNHLGRALLTASRFNKPIQMVVIVAVTGPRGYASPTAKSPAP